MVALGGKGEFVKLIRPAEKEAVYSLEHSPMLKRLYYSSACVVTSRQHCNVDCKHLLAQQEGYCLISSEGLDHYISLECGTYIIQFKANEII